MWFVLLVIKWILFYAAAFLLSQVQLGFLYFNLWSWQLWGALGIAILMFEIAIAEEKQRRRKHLE